MERRTISSRVKILLDAADSIVAVTIRNEIETCDGATVYDWIAASVYGYGCKITRLLNFNDISHMVRLVLTLTSKVGILLCGF